MSPTQLNLKCIKPDDCDEKRILASGISEPDPTEFGFGRRQVDLFSPLNDECDQMDPPLLTALVVVVVMMMMVVVMVVRMAKTMMIMTYVIRWGLAC